MQLGASDSGKPGLPMAGRAREGSEAVGTWQEL